MVRNIRAMILRSGLSDQQVRTIRGMIVALVRNKYRRRNEPRMSWVTRSDASLACLIAAA